MWKIKVNSGNIESVLIKILKSNILLNPITYMNAIESTQHYKGRIEAELQNTLTETTLEKEEKIWKSS